MKNIALSAAVAALIGSVSAAEIKASPDVYGPNGDGYENTSAGYDLSRIGIDITERSSEPKKCNPGDWTTVHWSAHLKDGREISNSRAEPGAMPKTFSLGAREVFHCWDLAIPQLHQGDKAHLDCPSYYAYGGAFTQAPLGGEPIPLHSDVEFDIEIVECNRTPERVYHAAQPKTTTMQPGRCMYIHSEASAQEGTPLVLTCENEERITEPHFNRWPAVPCYLEEWVKESQHQQFHFDINTGKIHDFAHEWELCYQMGYLALCDFKQFDARETNPKWYNKSLDWHYDGVTETLQHPTDWGMYFPYVEHTNKWAQVLFDYAMHQDKEQLNNINAQFRIEYCWKNL